MRSNCTAQEHSETIREFDLASQQRISLIKRGWEDSRLELEAIAALFDSSDQVTRAEFRTFVGRLLPGSKGIQALEWVPRVPRTYRRSYVEKARRDGFPTFEINTKNEASKVVASPQRDEYFPVYFVEPFRGNEAALGYDVASESARLRSLELSRDTGEVVATSRMTLVQAKGDQYGFLVYVPIYKKGSSTDTMQSRRENLAGFGLAVFSIGDLVKDALADSKSGRCGHLLI